MTPHPRLLKSLWLAGTGLAVFIATLAVGNAVVSEDRRLTANMVGHDFLAFYTAGTLVRTGRSHDLYDLGKVKAFQHELAAREGLEIGPSFGPFWNPPFYAWVFVPISALPYRTALATWEGINIACLAASLWLIVRMIRKPGDGAEAAWRDLVARGGRSSATSVFIPFGQAHLDQPREVSWRIWGLAPLLVAVSMPAIQAITHGQNTMVSLLLLTGALALWHGGRPAWAGAVAGLLFYKPQLALVFAGALALLAGRRAIIGLFTTGVILLVLANVLTLPGTLGDYQRLMPGNLRQFQVENVYLWDRHVTLRAFCRLLLQGREPGEMWLVTRMLWLGSCALLAGGLGWAWLKLMRERSETRRAIRRDWLLASTIAAMPLLMPFYFDYDLLLLSASAALAVRAKLHEGEGPVSTTPDSERSHDPGSAPTAVHSSCTTTDPQPAAYFSSQHSGLRTGDFLLLPCWVALYVLLFFSSALARVTHVNFSVVLLAGVAGLMIRRAGAMSPIAKPSDASRPIPLARAA